MTEAQLVKRFISKLQPTQAIEQEVYVRSSIADIIINDNVAIEAKLKDIRKALIQANSYKSKYKYSYILMPKKSKKIITNYENLLMKNKIRWMFLDDNDNLSFGRSWWKNQIITK